MTINSGIRFIYDNIISDTFDVVLATSIGSVTRFQNIETRNIIITKNTFKNMFDFHYVDYSEPLKFDIIIYNQDGTWIDAYKERQLKKWLLKSKPSWFQVDQDDLNDIMYWAIGISAEMIDIGAYSGGMKITFQCLEPWAWSDLKKKKYTSVSSLNFNLNNVVDFDDYIIYPQIKISVNSGTTISIKNNTTNEILSISGCTVGEVINIDCGKDKLKSSTSRILLSSWNKQTLSIIEGINSFTLTGNFSVEVMYRLPIRVGG